MPAPQSLCQIQLNCGDMEAPDWQGFGAGILIHPQWVLTAAHVSKAASEPLLLRVVLGDPPSQMESGISSHQTTRSFIGVQSQHSHPDFNPQTDTPVHADMALLHLAEPATGFAVQAFLVDWDWYQNRWQHRQLLLQFWGRPFQEGYADVVENDKRLHAIRREESDGVLGLQMATEEDSQLAVEGGIPNGFSGGPVLTTLRNGEQACVGLTVQGGALFGKAASTSFALSTRLILPWLDAFSESDEYRHTNGNETLYRTLDAKDSNAFSIFNWRPAADYQTLYDKDNIGALLTWNTALSPLIGRAREQQEFDAWLERIKQQTDHGIVVRVVHGEGGVGKTRFVCEWAEACAKKGWQVADASRVQKDAWRDIEQAIARDSASPWLIVMDYPELAQAELFQAIRAWVGAADKTQQHIALVLLSRHGEERWQSILEENNANELQIDYYPLSPIEATESHRLLTQVLDKLSPEKIAIPQDDYRHWLQHEAAKAPDGRPYMEYPLMILGQAVCLAKDPEQDFRQLSHETVLAALVQMVWRKLELAEKHQGIQRDQAEWQLSHRLTMLTTLFGDLELSTLKALSQNSECDELGLPLESRQVGPRLSAQGLNLLRQNTLHPMTPDVFATAFAQTVFERMDSTLKAQFARWCAAILQQNDITQALERFAQRYADSVFGLKKPFQSAYDGLIHAFLTHTDLLESEKALGYFQGKKGVLPALGVQVLSHRVETLRIRANTDFAAYGADLAGSLNDLSILLETSGDHSSSLSAIQEAVKTYRLLSKKKFAVYGPVLAGCLINLSSCLAESENYPESLKAIRESIEIFRCLARENFVAYGSDLAMSLNTLSTRLAEVGDCAGGLEAIQESVAIRRKFAEKNFAAFGPDLAKSLNNLSRRLAESGDHSTGLSTIQKAVEIYRRFANENFAAYGSDLARSLNTLSNRLAESKNHPESLKAIQESVKIYRHFAKESFAAYGPNLAQSLHMSSHCLADLGNNRERLKAIQESVDIYRQFAKERFGKYGLDLALALETLSDCLSNDPKGLKASQESVNIYRHLAKESFAAIGPNLAQSLYTLSIRLGASRDFRGGATAAYESTKIYRQFAKKNFAYFGEYLAKSLLSLSINLAESGDSSQGMTAIRESFEIYRSLAMQNFVAYGSYLGNCGLTYFYYFSRDCDDLSRVHEIYKEVRHYSNLHWIRSYPQTLNKVLDDSKYEHNETLNKAIQACLDDLNRINEKGEPA